MCNPVVGGYVYIYIYIYIDHSIEWVFQPLSLNFKGTKIADSH